MIVHKKTKTPTLSAPCHGIYTAGEGRLLKTTGARCAALRGVRPRLLPAALRAARSASGGEEALVELWEILLCLLLL